MRYKKMSIAVVAGAVLGGLLMPPAQTNASQLSAAKLDPAQVVYTFNNIRPGGIVRDLTPPKHLRMQLGGNWKRTTGLDGKKHAVALRAKSRGAINYSRSLVPRGRSFAVAMTVKLRQFEGSDTPNLAQLGFYRDRSQWKVEVLPKTGRIQFRVKGKSGSSTITSRRTIDDGEYHLVVCFRKRGKVGVIVDGARRVRNSSAGRLQSQRPVFIGNKHLRTPDDQFRGNFDYFSIALGRNPIARAVAKAPPIP